MSPTAAFGAKSSRKWFLEMPPKTEQDRPANYHDEQLKHPGGKGLRLIHFWVPDVRTPDFMKQAHSQSLAVATSRWARQDQSFLDAVSDLLLDQKLH